MPKTTPSTQIYPDISPLIAAKLEGRKIAAQRTFGQKIDWLERIQPDLKLFRAWRGRKKLSGGVSAGTTRDA